MKQKCLFQACVHAGLLSFLVGCSSVHVSPQPHTNPIHHLAVPFVVQEDAYCGPAAAAMLLQYNQQHISANDLAPAMLLPARSGSLQVEVKAALREQKMLVYPVDPNLDGLFAAIDAHYPVLVLLNLSFNWYPKWHYAVVTGYDLKRQTITVHSGTQADQPWSLTQFENLWARGQHWGIVAIPPASEVPSFASEATYVSAVVDVEHTAGSAVAYPAYGESLTRWPTNLTALIGLGTYAYSQHHWEQALHWFGLAVQQHPDSPVAANNYAQTLLDSGDPVAALPWAEKAIALRGGSAAEDTLQQILTALHAK